MELSSVVAGAWLPLPGSVTQKWLSFSVLTLLAYRRCPWSVSQSRRHLISMVRRLWVVGVGVFRLVFELVLPPVNPVCMLVVKEMPLWRMVLVVLEVRVTILIMRVVVTWIYQVFKRCQILWALYYLSLTDIIFLHMRKLRHTYFNLPMMSSRGLESNSLTLESWLFTILSFCLSSYFASE